MCVCVQPRLSCCTCPTNVHNNCLATTSRNHCRRNSYHASWLSVGIGSNMPCTRSPSSHRLTLMSVSDSRKHHLHRKRTAHTALLSLARPSLRGSLANSSDWPILARHDAAAFWAADAQLGQPHPSASHLSPDARQILLLSIQFNRQYLGLPTDPNICQEYENE